MNHLISATVTANLQANSPIRTLDELNVSEVVSSPYFPSMVERRQGNLNRDDQSIFSNYFRVGCTETSILVGDRLESTNGLTDLRFGMRKKHRCLVVTARARAFLYHQVGFI